MTNFTSEISCDNRVPLYVKTAVEHQKKVLNEKNATYVKKPSGNSVSSSQRLKGVLFFSLKHFKSQNSLGFMTTAPSEQLTCIVFCKMMFTQ
jgi:hypothetical protein